MRPASTLPMFTAALLLAACHSPGTPGADDAAAPTPPPQSPTEGPSTDTTSAFRCGDLLLGVVTDNAAETVTVSWSGHRRTLPAIADPSGAAYADDRGTRFEHHDGEATFAHDGAPPVTCQATDEISPWDEARARGVSLRAIGNEPGWLAEITPGDPPSLRAQLDYGERVVEVPALSKDEALPGFTGSTGDGFAVSLRFVEGACSDGMSDQSYPASVELTVGADRYQGCGALLR